MRMFIFSVFTRAIIVVVSALVFASGCTTSTKNFQSGVIPAYAHVEQDAADKNRYLVSNMMEEEGLNLQKSGAGYQRVKAIINQLSAAANIEQELDVYTVDAGTETVNAFAMGGNTIVVYQELINRLPKDEELAVIIGHEIAHILGQHHADDTEQKRGAAWSMASSVLGTAVAIATDSSLAGDLTETGTTLAGTGITRSYGRSMEHEADHIGMLLMAKAGYDPQHAITVWDKADEVLGAGNGPSFFSSHPSHGNRKERLEQDYLLAQPIYEQYKSK